MHAEAQYGARFPKSWRWVQATDTNADARGDAAPLKSGPDHKHVALPL